MFGPYRVPAVVEPAPPERGRALVPAREEPDLDELPPVARAHDGAPPIDPATGDRIAATRAVWLSVYGVVVVVCTQLFESMFRR